VGRAAPQADKLERLYAAMPDTMERCLPEPPVGELDVMQAISVIAKALRTKALRDRVIEELSRLLPGGLRREVLYRVEHEDVEILGGDSFRRACRRRALTSTSAT
jgi:hypothetical protein